MNVSLYLTGGGGWEGKLEKEIKIDPVLPAYCNPPNPCPVGYNNGDDGCTETFENTAAFSRDYQAAQDCMCDTEHMFECPAVKEQNNELGLAQTTDLLLKNLGLAVRNTLIFALQFACLNFYADPQRYEPNCC